jgi:hypothetical protein
MHSVYGVRFWSYPSCYLIMGDKYSTLALSITYEENSSIFHIVRMNRGICRVASNTSVSRSAVEAPYLSSICMCKACDGIGKIPRVFLAYISSIMVKTIRDRGCKSKFYYVCRLAFEHFDDAKSSDCTQVLLPRSMFDVDRLAHQSACMLINLLSLLTDQPTNQTNNLAPDQLADSLWV